MGKEILRSIKAGLAYIAGTRHVEVTLAGDYGFGVEVEGKVVYKAHSIARCWDYIATLYFTSNHDYIINGETGEEWVKDMIKTGRISSNVLNKYKECIYAN